MERGSIYKVILLISIVFTNYSIPSGGISRACPGGSNNCVAFPNFWKVKSKTPFLKQWNESCTECQGYDYGVLNVEIVGGEVQQTACANYGDYKNKIPIPTRLSSCEVNSDQFVCKENFYLSSNNNECEACVNNILTCPKGFYFERCQKVAGSIDCKPCANPIPNQATQEYDSYVERRDSCSHLVAGSFLTFDEKNEPSCLPYLTPWWDEYKCPLRCRTNYKNIGEKGDANCVPCYERCEAGQYCGGDDDTRCYECKDDGGISLGSNQKWLPSTDVHHTPCRVGCAEGYYNTQKSESGLQCQPCPESQQCPDSKIFLGCTGESAGSCQDPSITCVRGETYLYYQVFSAAAECRVCSAPTLGETFIVSDCDSTEDTRLQACSASCQSRGDYFKTHNCTFYQDIQCQKCTNPLQKQGWRLIESCKEESDNIFQPCSDGKACDGTSEEKDCPRPKEAKNGLCVCPKNTFLYGEVCVQVQCASGFFPHPETGQCVSCNRDSQHSVVTLDGVWGKDACACKEGYFIQRLESSAQDAPAIRCWPCGNLTCLYGIEAQTPCMGSSTDEPACQCMLPPGVKASEAYGERCRITSCEPGLLETATLTIAAAQPARIWETSLWNPQLPASEESIVLAKDFQEVTSAAVIGEGTLVYVVNHVDLMLAVRWNHTSWRTGQIDNKLFISGNRGVESNQLLDISVCSDTTEGRFWMSFVMLAAACGEASDGVVGICSNFELIEVRDQDGDDECQSVEGENGLIGGKCVYNLFRIWTTSAISSGIPKLRIFSTTLHYKGDNNNVLYMAIGDEYSNKATKVYTYTIHYYPIDTPDRDRIEEDIRPISDQYHSGGIAQLLWIENDLVALMVDGALTRIARGVNYVAGFEKILSYFGGNKRLSWIVQGGGSGNLVALSDGVDAATYEADLWNGWVLKHPSSTMQHVSYVFPLFNAWISIKSIKNNSVLTWSSNYMPCPLDHMRMVPRGPCILQPCLLLKEACGPNSMREAGQTVCTCLAGYFFSSDTNQCILCTANYYCPRNTPKTPCPSNAISPEGASSPAQCQCSKGYYLFESLCMECPRGFWCYGQKFSPIKCSSGSDTEITGMFSPVACKCNSRTYGIDCRACPAAYMCTISRNQPAVSAMYISGSGPMDAESILNSSCLRWGVSIVYRLPQSIAMSTSIAKKRGKIWSWIVVSEVLPVENGLVQNVSTCMIAHNFSLDVAEIYTEATAEGSRRNVQNAVRYPLHYEWAGDFTTQERTCIAGYEEVQSAFQLNIKFCAPCKNGTFRKDKTWAKCVECQENNTHAPWMGMDHCICRDGYFKNHLTGECEPLPARFASYDLVASPFLVIPISLVFIILCALGVWIASFLT